MQLNTLREIIDQIDEKIVQLLNERSKIASKVGIWKIENGHPIFVPEREKQLFSKIIRQNRGPLSPESLTNIYREIISGSIALEQPLKIGYHIEDNAESLKHPARLTFGDSAEYVRSSSIRELFTDVENRVCDYGVVSFRDKNGEVNNDAITALLTTNLGIVAERISTEQKKSSLIIGIQSPTHTGDDRTAFRIGLAENTDSAEPALDILRKSGIELLCCELRITQKDKKKPMIFIEITGHPADDKIRKTLDDIAELFPEFTILGGFPIL